MKRQRFNTRRNLTRRVEPLESRLLLTGDVLATLIHDVNGNGAKDPEGVRGTADPGIPGWTVFLDLNTDRALNPGEPSTVNGRRRLLLL